MTYAIFAVLVAIPLTLIGWIVWEGQTAAPAARTVASAAAEPSAAAKTEDPADAKLKAFFDGAPGGVKAKGDISLFNDKDLFDYIDGAAPLYIERGFRRLAAAEMATPEGAELTCDIYDMQKAENAASIFLEEQSEASQPVEDWPKAITGPMSFVFRDGPYYVKLTAFDKNAEAALPALARALRERMTK